MECGETKAERQATIPGFNLKPLGSQVFQL